MSDEADASPSEEFLRAVALAPAVEPPSTELELVGQTLGHFKVLSRLGKGGMGIVYRAKDARLGREVALKVLPPDVIRDAMRRRRFLREARLAAAITHPNLVAIYEVGESEHRVYLAMELVDGHPLREKLSSGSMEVPEVLRVSADIARGVARAHAAGIVHRDLKPENIMVATDGSVKILDFGIATIRTDAIGEATPTESGGGDSDLGIVVGTPSYMSPEQAKLGEITVKSDCFALGVLFYEMLAGHRPFNGNNAFEIVIAIDRDPPRPLDGVRPGIPDRLSRLVMRCLEKDPERRPTADEIARELVAIESGAEDPVSAAPPGAGSSVARPLWVAGLLAAGLVGALVVSRSPGPAEPLASSVPAVATLSAPTTSATEVIASSSVVAPAASASAHTTTSSTASVNAPRAGRSAVASSNAAPSTSAAPPPSATPAQSSTRDPLADPI